LMLLKVSFNGAVIVVFWSVTLLFTFLFGGYVRTNADFFSTTPCLNEGEVYVGGSVFEMYGLDRSVDMFGTQEEIEPDEITRLQQACLSRDHLNTVYGRFIVPYLIFVLVVMILMSSGQYFWGRIRKANKDMVEKEKKQEMYP